MKKELVHPNFPLTEFTIRETIVNDGEIKEIEKKIAMPSLLLDSCKDEKTVKGGGQSTENQ